MRIKLKYPDVETFIQKYAVNISRGGIFIATRQPKPVGTALKFEFLLGESAISIIRGEGQVLWTREFDPDQPTKAHGMGVRFTKLDAESQAIVDRALAFKGKDQPLPAEPSQVKRPPPAPVEPPAAKRPAPPPPPRAAPPPPPAPPPPAPIVEARRPEPEAKLPSGGEEQARPEPPPRPPEPAPKPIPKPEAVAPRAAPPARIPTREPAVREPVPDDLDSLAREWGISDEQIDRVLKRARAHMGDASAELERLLRNPPEAPPPSRAEALAGLKELLERGSR
jgi:uncharacterized protein (TIGR02266 family)